MRNGEVFYSAISFFVEEEAGSLGKLLATLTPKLDHSRTVHLLKKLSSGSEGGPHALLGLVLPYLRSVQPANIAAVNDAVNAVLLEEEDHVGLADSIAKHDAFDQIGLASRLEKHELLEMRRIAARLFKANKRFEASIALSKRDAQYADAIATASASADQGLAEGLMAYFVGKGDKESFAATLFTCGALIRPDVAMEAAWRARCVDYAMPFMLQFIRDSNARIAALEARVAPKKEEDSAPVPEVHPAYGGGFGAPVLALANEAYNPVSGYGHAPPPPLGGMANYGMPGMGGMPGAGAYGMPPPGMY